MRVRMVLGQYRPLVGGAELQAELLATRLVAAGVAVDFVTGRPRGVPARLPEDPVPVTRLRVPGFGRVKMGFLALAIYHELVGSSLRPDVIHVHQAHYPSWAGVRAARALGVPSIVKCGNAGERFDLRMLSRLRPFGGPMADYVAGNADVFVSLNGQVDADLEAHGVERARIRRIPNGVELPPPPSDPERSRLREALGLPGDALVVTSVGSLLPKKNIAHTLEAVARARVGAPRPIVLVVLGSGPQRQALEAKAQALGIGAAVRFTGHLPRSAVREHLGATDVYVLTSLTEGMPNALLEALAAGVACVATDVPGSRDLIRPGETGRLVPPGDLGCLADTLRELLADPALRRRLGTAARRQVAGEHAIDAIAERYMALYRELTVNT